MRLRRLLAYGLSIALMGAGLMVFTAAEAGALGTGAGSCVVSLSGSLPSNYVGNASPNAVFGVDLNCTGISANYRWARIVYYTGTQAVGVSIGTPYAALLGTNFHGTMADGTAFTFGGGGTEDVTIGGYIYGAETVVADVTAPGLTIEMCDYGCSTDEWIGSTAGTMFGVAPIASPCTLVSIAGYKSGQAANGNTIWHYTFTFSGAVAYIIGFDDGMNNPVTGGNSYTYGSGLATAMGHSTYQNGYVGDAFVSNDLGPIYKVNDSVMMTVVDTSVVGGTVDPHFWCSDINPNLATSSDWTDWGHASAMTVTGTGGAGAVACSFQSMTGDPAKTADGTSSYPFVLTFTGGGDYIVAVDDGATGSGTQVIDGKTFNSYQVLAIHKNPANPNNFNLLFDSGDTTNPHFWCDSGGVWQSWGLAAGMTLTTPPNAGFTQGCGDGGSFCLGTCWAFSDYNPLSWGFWSDLMAIPICGGRWLMEPSSATWHSVSDQFGVHSNTPSVGASSASQWLGAVGAMLAVGPHDGAVAIQSAQAGGATSSLLNVGMSVTANGHTYTADAPSAIAAVAGTGGSWSSVLVGLLTAFLLVLFFIEVVRVVRKILGSGE